MQNENESLDKIAKLELGETSKLKLLVWRVRRMIKHSLKGKDVLDPEGQSATITKTRELYKKVDEFVLRQLPLLASTTPVDVAVQMVRDKIIELEYTIVDEDTNKPWGAYFRMDNNEAERFISEFFPGLTIEAAKLGNDTVELSPKFLLVAPGHRLSWQYHHRRAERWRFLTDGAYYKSSDDNTGDVHVAATGEVVQFSGNERHRLCANQDGVSYTLVAEIWQHIDPAAPSDENDIVRVQDDYKR